MFSNFNPLIYGATFWQTLATNWWYNVGRDFFNDPIKASKYWYDAYIENLKEFYPMFSIYNINKGWQKTS